jgi:hypothetical protein
MPNPSQLNPTPTQKPEVLQASPHAPLSAEVVAKALARHKREHPDGKANQPKPKKRH